MFRTLALAVVATALAAASTSAQAPYKLGMTISGYGTHSVQVQDVFDGSIADQMGILPGDVIYGINGGSTNDVDAFRNAVFGSDRVTLNIQRGNRLYTTRVRFNAAPRPNGPVAVTSTQTTELRNYK